MRKEYHEIFERLYRDSIYEFSSLKFFRGRILNYGRRRYYRAEYRIYREMVREINRLDVDHVDMPIRSDAKFFLLVVLHQMVIIPVLDSAYSSRKLSVDFEDQLKADLISDVVLILNEASRAELVRNREISAHSVLTSFDRNWGELKLARFELWND